MKLTKRKLLSTLRLVRAAAAGGVGTLAYFSDDTEIRAGLIAASIDLSANLSYPDFG
ncbi:SipW-dependent-type signal peptide-containing protein [Halomicrococcus gelatinilyticus]|uniref:SipW-dependent-type signal peptide-containing protein n=1 Tax=Halomicrococcus gelatinilyticus TaxID=1702103 RepID=UPI003898EFD0